MAQGTYYTLDTLQSLNQGFGTPGLDMEALKTSLQMLTDAHNAIVRGLIGELVEETTDADRLYGTGDTMQSVEIGEFDRPNAQKISYGSKVGFPLRRFAVPLQWTRLYQETATVAEMTNAWLGAQDADFRRVNNEIQKALFYPTDYDWTDPNSNRRSVVPIKVRALANADGEALPPGPNGEAFDGSSHTHYLATNSFVNADLVAALETVLEHYSKGAVRIFINRAQEAAVKAFADFTGLLYPAITPATTRDVYAGPRLDAIQLYNRDIGYFHGALVCTRPWVPQNYVVVSLQNEMKMLCMRTRRPGSGGFRIVWEDGDQVFRAQQAERECGFGVYNRVGGAVLYTGGSSYTAPTIS